MSGFFDQEVGEGMLLGCRNGDTHAQGRLFQAFSSPVFTLALRLTGSRPLADEVVQDTFVEVLTKIDQFRGDAPIGAWIRRIALNKSLAQLRSPWFKRGEALKTDLSASKSDMSVRLDLETSLMRLTTTARTVLWLHDVEGYTHKEIGAFVGKTASFSKSQLSRAHRRLHDWAIRDLAGAESTNRDKHSNSQEETTCMPALNN